MRRLAEWWDRWWHTCVKCGVRPTDKYGCDCPQVQMRRYEAEGYWKSVA